MKKFSFSVALLAFVLFFAIPHAFGQDPISYELSLSHEAHEPAILRVHANENLKNLKIGLKGCSPKKSVQFSVKSLAAGESKEFTWSQPAGVYQCAMAYRCMLVSDKGGGHFEGFANHEMRSVSPLDFEINLREMSSDSNEISFKSNRPISQIELEVIDEDGAPIDRLNKRIEPAKSEHHVAWKKNDKKPALIQVKISDDAGAWSTRQLFYFQIPHTDIVFDTGKSNIRKDQEKYLAESQAKIIDIIKRHEQVAMDLYIAGYTDTVGTAADNLKLSLSRARSIARWFGKNGVKIAIYYQGFGEKVLAVQTKDETDEEKNRRAVYILTNSPPKSESFPEPNWNKL